MWPGGRKMPRSVIKYTMVDKIFTQSQPNKKFRVRFKIGARFRLWTGLGLRL